VREWENRDFNNEIKNVDPQYIQQLLNSQLQNKKYLSISKIK